METIGLFAAMPQECDALLRLVSKSKRMEIGGLPCYEFQTGGHKCILVRSGMGMRRAREAARILVEKFSPQTLISFGIAGAVRADLAIGDVVAIQAACLLEEGKMGPLLPLASLSLPAQTAAIEAVRPFGAKLVCGTAITTKGSQPVSLPAEIAHPVLEMETVAIAAMAEEKEIPFLALRSVSDGPLAPLPFDPGEVIDEEGGLRIVKLLETILRHPEMILQSMRMERNVKLAARNAAVALSAALGQPFFLRLPVCPPDFA